MILNYICMDLSSVVDDFKFLGLIFDRKLSFIPHIKYLKAKCLKALKGAATLMISMFYMKGLYEPSILIPVSSKSVEKIWKLWAFEYLQMDSYGSGHFVGLVTSHSLIKYA